MVGIGWCWTAGVGVNAAEVRPVEWHGIETANAGAEIDHHSRQ